MAKASTFALIGMTVIVFTVLVQGALVPREDRGSFDKSLLLVNDGIFQAIGVISFGTSILPDLMGDLPNMYSFCLPPQLSFDLRIP